MVEAASEENAFLIALHKLESGQTLRDLHHAMEGLIGDVRAHGKAGTIQLTIKIKPKSNSQQLVLSDDYKVSAPKPDRDITILFVDDNNRLTSRDPRQPRLAGVDADVRQFPAAVNDAPRAAERGRCGGDDVTTTRKERR